MYFVSSDSASVSSVRHLQGALFRTSLAVDGSADDSAGIARTLAAGIESGETNVVKRERVAEDSHRSGSACFNGNHRCFRGQEAVAAASELKEAISQTAVEEGGEPEVEWGRNRAGRVTCSR